MYIAFLQCPSRACYAQLDWPPAKKCQTHHNRTSAATQHLPEELRVIWDIKKQNCTKTYQHEGMTDRPCYDILCNYLSLTLLLRNVRSQAWQIQICSASNVFAVCLPPVAHALPRNPRPDRISGTRKAKGCHQLIWESAQIGIDQ